MRASGRSVLLAACVALAACASQPAAQEGVGKPGAGKAEVRASAKSSDGSRQKVKSDKEKVKAAELGKLPADSVEITCRDLDDETASLLLRFKSLETLDISGSYISSKSVPVIAELTSLKSLDVSWLAKLTSQDFKTLVGLPKLTAVNVTANVNFDDGALSALKGIKELHASWAGPFTAQAFALFAGQSPGLEVVDLSACAQVDLAFARTLATLRSLRVVRLNLCKNLKEDGLAELLKLPKLEILEVSGTKVTGEAFAGVSATSANPLSSLSELSFDACENLALKILEWLAVLPALEVLSISGCPKMHSTPFNDVTKMKCLRKLDLSFNEWVQDAHITSVAACGRLSHVNLRAIESVRISHLRTLASTGRAITIVLESKTAIPKEEIAKLKEEFPSATIELR